MGIDPQLLSAYVISYTQRERTSDTHLAWLPTYTPSIFKGRSGPECLAKCNICMAGGDLQHVTQNQAAPLAVSRRVVLQSIALLGLRYLASPVPALAFDDGMETFVWKSLNVSVDYPVGWFRSERGGKLVLLNLKQVLAATLSKKQVILSPLPDPYSAAYDMVRDRIEQEGAEIVIKDAAFDADNALIFRFEATTEMPNGDSVVRLGISRCIPSKDRKSSISCVVTMPKESWEDLRPIADRIIRSMKFV